MKARVSRESGVWQLGPICLRSVDEGPFVFLETYGYILKALSV